MFDNKIDPFIESFYEARLARYQRSGTHFATAICPFHADTNPSFSVNLSSGAYRCFACGVLGDDYLTFQTLTDNRKQEKKK